jgi:ATP-dependent Lon protease
MSGHPVLPSDPITLPLLPLRDVVVFPHMVIPLFVGRPKSIKALEAAMEQGRQIMLVAQKAAGKDEPKPTTCSRSAASAASCRCSSCPTAP